MMRKFLLILCPVILLAQSNPSFDVATIKPSDVLEKSGVTSGWSVSFSKNSVATTGTLQTFIKYAYGIEDVQIIGGPAWLNWDMYEIIGKTGRDVAVEDLKRMLQSLLIERFRLATHSETRELPIFSMVLANSGSRLQPGDAAQRGVFSFGATFLRGTLDSGSLAAHLTSTLHRAVIDNTGLHGVWEVNLKWAADDVATGPSIFTAIQEQLGLKLKSVKGPVQVLVIDRAEKPSDN
jgi:uncharacterized protein (TIGR03435 family)